jgi:predicted esterase
MRFFLPSYFFILFCIQTLFLLKIKSAMQAHQFKVSKTAHYYTLGTLSPKTKRILLVFHGYGQLAQRFIQKFNQLEDCFVIAPEGFARFYWKGTSGDVGASWMTKEDRTTEIDDYSLYLSQLYAHFGLAEHDAELIFCAFSQGGATALRWMARTQPRFDRLLLWGVSVPQDIDYVPLLPYFEAGKTQLLYGDADEYITPKRLESAKQFLEAQRLPFELIFFEGKHIVDRSLLHKLLE